MFNQVLNAETGNWVAFYLSSKLVYVHIAAT